MQALPFLTALSGTCSTSNQGGESGHLCLISDLRRKALTLTVSVMSEGGFVDELHLVEELPLFSQFAGFLSVLNFVKCFHSTK